MGVMVKEQKYMLRVHSKSLLSSEKVGGTDIYVLDGTGRLIERGRVDDECTATFRLSEGEYQVYASKNLIRHGKKRVMLKEDIDLDIEMVFS